MPENLFPKKLEESDNQFLEAGLKVNFNKCCLMGLNIEANSLSWEDIFKDKGKGGLGIQDLWRFNLALLSKWVWRFLTEPGRLWARVIRSKYGGLETISSERLRGSGHKRGGGSGGSSSGWWRDICEIYKGSGSSSSGHRNDTSFWSDTWVDELPLKSKFNILYRVSEQRESKVGEMGSWDDCGWNWVFRWSRELRGREVFILNELISCLNRFKMQQDSVDSWRWIHSNNGVFSTSTAYKKIEEQVAGSPNGAADDKAFERLWSSHAPKRQQTIVWKILKERMPTRDKLRRRGIIQENGDVLCVFCGEEEESPSDVLFHCKFSYGIWCNFFDWLNLTTKIRDRSLILCTMETYLGPARVLGMLLLFGLELCGVFGNAGTRRFLTIFCLT
ncbi:hypothetical protein ACS0TY_032009 [Phlomoides rotata]